MYETALRSKGMNILLRELGSVEAERFINLVIRDNIDYTEWRKNELVEPDSLEELSRQATAFAKRKHSAEKS